MALFDLPQKQLEAFVSSASEPADFDDFWASTLAEARGHDVAVRLDPVETGLGAETGQRSRSPYQRRLRPPVHPRTHRHLGNAQELSREVLTQTMKAEKPNKVVGEIEGARQQPNLYSLTEDDGNLTLFNLAIENRLSLSLASSSSPSSSKSQLRRAKARRTSCRDSGLRSRSPHEVMMTGAEIRWQAQRSDGSDMKFHSLRISNLRAVRTFEIDDLKDFIVVAGPNGSGKSCVFDAIRLLKSVYGGYSADEQCSGSESSR